MFIGQHSLPLDNQCRLALPARFSELIGPGVVLTQGFDRNLMVMPRPYFAGLGQRAGALNLADPSARLLRRLLLGTAFECTPDSSGRIDIPADLCDYAGLDGQVVVVGQGDYFEIWDAAQWQIQQSRLRDADANADRFAALDIAV